MLSNSLAKFNTKKLTMKKIVISTRTVFLVLLLFYQLNASAQSIFLKDGTFKASNENGSNVNETSGKVIDNNINTKFLLNPFPAGLYVQFKCIQPVIATHYYLTSANDAPARDPKNWNVAGSNDGTTWTTLDTRTNETFPNRFQTKGYTFTNSTAYTYYRLNITAISSGTLFQLAEWQLFESAVPTGPASDIMAKGGSTTSQFAGNGTNEANTQVTDGAVTTKYLTNNVPPLWIKWTCTTPITAKFYRLASANDSPERDPLNWTLEGSNDDAVWTPLDTRTGETFADRLQFKMYSFTNSTAYKHYRLNVANHNNNPVTAIFQLADWRLFEALSSSGDPTNLAATPTSGSEVFLTWTDNAMNESSSTVERSEDGINFTTIATLGINQNSYSDKNLIVSSTYFYRVRAVTSAGNSNYTSIVGVTTLDFSGPLSDLTDPAGTGTLTVSNENTGNAAEASPKLIDNSNATKYLIPPPLPLPYTITFQPANGNRVVTAYTLTSGGDAPTRDPKDWLFEGSNDGTVWTTLDTRTNEKFADRVMSRTFAFTNSTPYSRYRLKVTANNGDTQRHQITEWQIWGFDPVAPAAPANLAATAVSSTKIQLSWRDNASNEIGFQISRSLDGTNFTIIDSVAANSTSFAGFDDTNLIPATTYYYRVLTLGTSSSNSVYANIAQATTKVSSINAPSNLALAVESHSQIKLTWTDNSNNETGFEIERSLNGTTFASIQTVAVGIAEYTNTGLTPSTKYYYRVRALGTPINSIYTSIANATTQVDPNLPVAPSNLTALASSHTQIALTWQDNSINETGFRIERSSNGVNFAPVDTAAVDGTTFTDQGLTPSTKYYYRVQSINTFGISEYTNVAFDTTLVDPNLPVAPGNLTAATVSHTQIGLTWQDKSSNESGYRVERSPDGTTFTAIDTTAANSTAFTDQGLSPVTKYYYRVQGINALGVSPYSSVVNATTAVDPNVPAIPGPITLKVLSDAEIEISWLDNSADETSFEIERSLNGTTFTLLATKGVDEMIHVDENLTLSTKYYYRMRAKNNAGYSPYAAIVNATTNAYLVSQNDITDDGGTLAAQYQSTNAADVTYSPAAEDYTRLTDNNPGSKYLIFGTPALYWFRYQPVGSYIVTKYTITSANDAADRDPKNWTFEGSNNGTTWTVLDTRTNQVFASRALAVDYSFTNSTSYAYYRVNVTSNNGSATIMGQIAEWQIWGSDPFVPVASGSLSAAAMSHTEIKLKWKDVASNETGFEIERSTDGSSFTLIHTSGAGETEYTDSGLTPLKKYYYRVRVVGPTSKSSYTRIASVTTNQDPAAPLPPSTFVSAALSNTEIGLSWKDNSSNETGFQIERSLDGITFTLLTTAPPNTTSHTDANLKVAQKYYYRMRGINDIANSAYTSIVSAITTGLNVPPTIDAIPDQSICNRTDVQTITLTGLTPGPEAGQQITLSVVSSTSAMFEELSISAADAGRATIKYKVKNNAVIGDAIITVTAKDNGGTNNNGSDTFSRIFTLTLFDLPVSIASDVNNLVPRGATLHLAASGAENFVWKDAPGIIEGQNDAIVTIRPTQNHTYIVTGTTSAGCSKNAEITIQLEGDYNLEPVNILTPNNDGKNDRWVIWNINTYSGNEVKVFDTAGRLVYSKKGYTNDWDGTYNGSSLAAGVYFYAIELGSGIPSKKGTLTIIHE